MKLIQRTFIPGSNWLYIKIYGGEKTLDMLLSHEIYYIIKKLYKKQIIKKWFFIRYADPEIHLRVRILMNEKKSIENSIELFYNKLNPLIKNNLIWKIQLDTYTRELERYGNFLIEEAESIFHIDSECAISCIRILNAISSEDYRWMISLKMIDSLLSDFSFNNEKKKDLMEQLNISFKKEFGFNEFNSKQLNTIFRENKYTIENVLKNKIIEKNMVRLYAVINTKSKRMLSVVEMLKKNTAKKHTNITIDQLLQSYIHMMMNRIFRSKSRIHELIIYDFMYRYYTGENARIKYNKQ